MEPLAILLHNIRYGAEPAQVCDLELTIDIDELARRMAPAAAAASDHTSAIQGGVIQARIARFGGAAEPWPGTLAAQQADALRVLEPRFRWSPDKEPLQWQEATRSEMVSANRDDPGLVAWLEAAKVGEKAVFGGGAAPAFYVRRVR